jgi:hypothetical protein
MDLKDPMDLMDRAPRPGPDEFDAKTRAWLWLSYQRYAFLLAAAGLGLPAGLYWLRPDLWLLWGASLLVTAWLATPIVHILAGFPKKLRATIVYTRRYRRNGFTPELMASLSEDPCSRLVAHEIMRRVGVPRPQARAIIARFAKEAREVPEFAIYVNHAAGTVDVSGRLAGAVLSPLPTHASSSSGKEEPAWPTP